MTSIPTSPSRPPSLAVAPPGVPTVGGRNDYQAGADVGPKMRITAYDGQDPLQYAEVVAGMGPEGNTADPSQWLDPSYQTFAGTQGARDTSIPDPLTFGVLLPPSFEDARLYAECGNRRHQPVMSIKSLSAEVTLGGWTRELRGLAKWLRPLHPEPVVGGLEVDPAGLVDQIGVKGLSVYSAFVDMEGLRCRICGQGSDTIDMAILHQRHKRHHQA